MRLRRSVESRIQVKPCCSAHHDQVPQRLCPSAGARSLFPHGPKKRELGCLSSLVRGVGLPPRKRLHPHHRRSPPSTGLHRTLNLLCSPRAPALPPSPSETRPFRLQGRRAARRPGLWRRKRRWRRRVTSEEVPAAVGLWLGSAGVGAGVLRLPQTAGGRADPRQRGVCFRKSGFKTCAPGSAGRCGLPACPCELWGSS